MLLLPYIEHEELFKEFRRDKPWDSEHNLRFLDRMPATYRAPGSKKKLYPPTHTVCHVLVGPGTAFEGPKGLPLKDFPDGLSNTLLVVEAGEPVPWTKPEDIPYEPAGLVQLRGPFKDMFRAGMGDGSVRYVRYDTPEEKLRAAITRNGGEWWGLDP